MTQDFLHDPSDTPRWVHLSVSFGLKCLSPFADRAPMPAAPSTFDVKGVEGELPPDDPDMVREPRQPVG